MYRNSYNAKQVVCEGLPMRKHNRRGEFWLEAHVGCNVLGSKLVAALIQKIDGLGPGIIPQFFLSDGDNDLPCYGEVETKHL